MNGTSDGEDNTPDSKKSSPASTPRKRSSQSDGTQAVWGTLIFIVNRELLSVKY